MYLAITPHLMNSASMNDFANCLDRFPLAEREGYDVVDKLARYV